MAIRTDFFAKTKASHEVYTAYPQKSPFVQRLDLKADFRQSFMEGSKVRKEDLCASCSKWLLGAQSDQIDFVAHETIRNAKLILQSLGPR